MSLCELALEKNVLSYHVAGLLALARLWSLFPAHQKKQKKSLAWWCSYQDCALSTRTVVHFFDLWGRTLIKGGRFFSSLKSNFGDVWVFSSWREKGKENLSSSRVYAGFWTICFVITYHRKCFMPLVCVPNCAPLWLFNDRFMEQSE